MQHIYVSSTEIEVKLVSATAVCFQGASSDIIAYISIQHIDLSI